MGGGGGGGGGGSLGGWRIANCRNSKGEHVAFGGFLACKPVGSLGLSRWQKTKFNQVW